MIRRKGRGMRCGIEGELLLFIGPPYLRQLRDMAIFIR